MPISRFPTSPSFQSFNVKINTPLQKTTAFSGKTRRVALGTQFYSFTVKFPQLTPQEAGFIQSFLAARLGGYDAFEIILPSASYTKAPSPPTGTPTVTATVAAGANSVVLNGLGANRTVIKGGDFFKFSNHSKVYIATSDVVSNGSGVGTLNFSGGLVYGVPATSTVVYTEVPFTVMLDGDAQSYEMGYGGITSMSLDLREVW